MDPLHAGVAADFSSRYCPLSTALFLARFWALLSPVVAIALAALLAASMRAYQRMPLIIVAGAFVLFALGVAALVLYGLSGCSGAPAEGLTWDWP
ncbi:MAG: hypothetical protein JO190_02090 [Candidatus Eremiobacteraeota bacterium]|nr:hypothetical protein [Candidatus Eremiobacteraeota bacterium]MBV8499575.1 hypothetical protein [Candidatus Eremiobacteraeota bacterium]